MKVFLKDQFVVINSPTRKDIDGRIGRVTYVHKDTFVSPSFGLTRIYEILVGNQTNGVFKLVALLDRYLLPANEEQEALYRLSALGG